MKKLSISLLFLASISLFGGCKNKKNNVTPTEQYIQVKVTDLSLMEDDTYQINTEIIKSGTIVFYSSADESVATVSDSGLITAVKKGETTITVRGGKDTYTIFLEVTPYQAKDSLQIMLDKESFTLAVGDEYTLPLQVKLGNVVINDAQLSFNIEQAGIISINGLVITAQSAGTTKCIATATYQQESVSKIFTVVVY